MLRLITAGLGRGGVAEVQKLVRHSTPSLKSLPKIIQPQRNLSLTLTQSHLIIPRTEPMLMSPLLTRSTLLQCLRPSLTQRRTLTKFSLRKGKRKAVKAVLKRFKRLHWGGWIRTRSGRHKKLWKKSKKLKRRLKQHVFVNATQSWLLDKMVTKYWRRPKYYIDDPYEPYHTREEYNLTKSKPKPL